MSDTFQQSDFDEQELQQLEPINPVDVRLKAMDLLARREHSRQELMQKLLKRFNDAELINEQLDRLVEDKLQSDARYAESYVRQRSNRGYGPLRIFQEMRQRGIPEDGIQDAMNAADYDWSARAVEVLHRKFGTAPAADISEKARRSRFMQYRGFSSEHFRDIL